MAEFGRLLEGDGRRSPDRAHFAWVSPLALLGRLRSDLWRSRDTYEAPAKQARAGFARFWKEEAGTCYDVLDGPEGNDPALRPNQLFAASLPHSSLPAEQQKAVVDICERHLLTSHGLRSLAADHPDYKGHHGGNRRTRNSACHHPLPCACPAQDTAVAVLRRPTVGVLRRGR